MTKFREGQFLTLNSTGFNRIVYSDWGPDDGRMIMCVHGLTGNGHDFNWIAPALAASGFRVIAVDMPGRGRSDFLANSMDYCYARYVHDLTALMAHLGITRPASVDWIGVSMGGLLGICLAGLPNTPIARMVINDIGPRVPQKDLDLIVQYISQPYRFDSIDQMTEFMKSTRGLSWGKLKDEQWRQMAENNARALDDGALTYAFDPRIADVFATEPVGDVDLWRLWDAMSQDVLVLRGSESSIFPQGVADEMLTRGPGKTGKMTLEIIEGCGHVPSLMVEDQVRLVHDWLLS